MKVFGLNKRGFRQISLLINENLGRVSFAFGGYFRNGNLVKKS
jgi:hypothetical protein